MTGLYIGIMSGTSVDAIDAVLVDFDTPGTGGPQLLASISHAWPDGLRRELLAMPVIDRGAIGNRVGQRAIAIHITDQIQHTVRTRRLDLGDCRIRGLNRHRTDLLGFS